MNAESGDKGGDPTRGIDANDAWQILLALAARAKAGNAVSTITSIAYRDGKVEYDATNEVVLLVDPEAPRLWSWVAENKDRQSAEVEQIFDIYMPLCVGKAANTLVLGHLGQSLDGRIATHGGVSQFITGDENIVHTHRLRALFNVVLVGANTASTDNPRLTTRRVEGEHPTRVLLDPRCSVDPEATIFTDGLTRTLVICDSDFAPADHADSHIALPAEDGIIAPSAIIAALQMLGFKRIFVEGGGVTVSQFLHSGSLERLHICIAPMIIGSGRPSFRLPEVDTLEECTYLDVQHFSSGRDLLFDCQLRAKE